MKRDKRDARHTIAAHLAALGDRLLALLLMLLAVDVELPRRAAGQADERLDDLQPGSAGRADNNAAHL